VFCKRKFRENCFGPWPLAAHGPLRARPALCGTYCRAHAALQPSKTGPWPTGLQLSCHPASLIVRWRSDGSARVSARAKDPRRPPCLTLTLISPRPFFSLAWRRPEETESPLPARRRRWPELTAAAAVDEARPTASFPLSRAGAVSRSRRLWRRCPGRCSAGDGDANRRRCPPRRPLFLCSIPHLFLWLFASSRSPSRLRPVASVESTPASVHGGGRRHALCPRRGLSLSAVVGASPSTAHVLRPTPRLADARRIERNGAALRRRIFAGEHEALSGEYFSFLFLNQKTSSTSMSL
jgi:hypothetical protein